MMRTESLNSAGPAALSRLERALAPAPSPLMSFPTLFGATVEVSAVDESSAPYRWTCSAGHDGGEAYASLPFCRDDAKAHAAGCPGTAPDPATVEKVRAALGFRPGWKPNPHLGETATYLTAWSQMELNDLFQRVGGAVSTRQVERSADEGRSTWTATEITLTVDVPDVGPVEVVTDIEDDPEHGYRTDVPVVLAANQPVPSDPAAVAALHRLEARLAGLRRGESAVINGVTCTAVSLRDADLLDRYDRVAACCRRKSATAESEDDFNRLLAVQDELAACRRDLADAGLLHLVGGA